MCLLIFSEFGRYLPDTTAGRCRTPNRYGPVPDKGWGQSTTSRCTAAGYTRTGAERRAVPRPLAHFRCQTPPAACCPVRGGTSAQKPPRPIPPHTRSARRREESPPLTAHRRGGGGSKRQRHCGQSPALGRPPRPGRIPQQPPLGRRLPRNPAAPSQS